MVNDQEFQNQHQDSQQEETPTQEHAKTSGTISNKDVIRLMEAAVNGALDHQQKIFPDKIKRLRIGRE